MMLTARLFSADMHDLGAKCIENPQSKKYCLPILTEKHCHCASPQFLTSSLFKNDQSICFLISSMPEIMHLLKITSELLARRCRFDFVYWLITVTHFLFALHIPSSQIWNSIRRNATSSWATGTPTQTTPFGAAISFVCAWSLNVFLSRCSLPSSQECFNVSRHHRK